MRLRCGGTFRTVLIRCPWRDLGARKREESLPPRRKGAKKTPLETRQRFAPLRLCAKNLLGKILPAFRDVLDTLKRRLLQFAVFLCPDFQSCVYIKELF
jgi:hypothetical protein